MENNSLLINRDISWLSFNGRVLEEAADTSLPIYERIKFLAIYSSNLDEFYRVRVAALRSLQKINKKKLNKKFDVDPDELIAEIKSRVGIQLEIFGDILRNGIQPELVKNNIHLIYNLSDIPESLIPELNSYFRSRILSYLQPIMLRPGKKTFLTNRSLYLILKLLSESDHEIHYAIVNIPSPPLPRFFSTNSGGYSHFIFIDDIIRLNLEYIFPGFTVSDAFSIKLNRDADLNIDDEFSGDLVQKMKVQLTKRNIGPSSRFLYDSAMTEDMLTAIMEASEIEEEELVAGGRYHNLHDLFGLPNPKAPDLQIKPWPSLLKKELENTTSLFRKIEEKDIMLNFPYHTYDYVLRFFNEAAIDPRVKEIKTTFYRVASDSFIVNALMSAARNGKKVQAFIEVKARFDEENNLRWADRMKDAGIKITYSIPGLKVHAKAALIKRLDADGKLQSFAFLGTGNFNEKTAGIYADHGLLTSNRELTKELNAVFRYLYKRTPVDKLKHLLVSQFNMESRFIEMIDREIENARDGRKAEILVKVNNLEDPKMISKLYDASGAGVKVILIVRGICCLKPGEAPYSSNIKIYRLVDRYLEHARIFVFHNGGKDEMYMGSADWMKRNLYHRIEVVFPILSSEIKEEIKTMIAFQLNDNIKGRMVDSEGDNSIILNKNNAPKIRAQRDFYLWLAGKEKGD